MKRTKIIGIILSLFLLVGLMPLATLPVAAWDATTSITVTKYDADGNVVGQQVFDIAALQDMTIQGDGVTHYWTQGPTFDTGDLWNPAETLNLKDKGALIGTDVKDLCEEVGGAEAGYVINIKAVDGYNEDFLYDDVYNPETQQGKMVISWIKDEQYSGTGEGYWADGMMLSFFAETANEAGQLVFGNQDMHDYLPEENWHYYWEGPTQYPSAHGLWIKWVSEISIHPAPPPTWELELVGLDTYIMDRNEFENGVACTEGGHGATWTDGDGNVWGGLPLWLLCGWVDDGNRHGPGAFNDEVAAYGYTVNVVAADDYTQTFTSAEVARNNNMIVANTLNGEDLPEDNYPLRLVGPDLKGYQKVGQIVKIELTELCWNLTLKGVYTHEMMQPEFESEVLTGGVSWVDGDDTWNGLTLKKLVGWVDDSDPATFNEDLAAAGYNIMVFASDGYNQTFASTDVAANDTWIVANTLNGEPLPEDIYPLKLVGPDLAGYQKVGQIVKIGLVGLPGADWSFELSGASTYTMTRTEFEEGVACHGAVTFANADGTYSGLPLWLLCGWVDDDVQHGPGAFNDALADAGYTIKVSASDGYSYTFASADVARNNGIIVANKLDGMPLPDGMFPIRLIGDGYPGTGGWQVRQIVSIELLNLPTVEEWELTLSGMVYYQMTQSEFEEGVACHGAVTYTDGSGTWSGMPLWLLCGWVDDDVQHGEGAFNDEMAAVGYGVKVTAVDGFSYTFASADVARNNGIIVANKLNDAPLPEDKYPLKLVGPSLTSGKQKVGQIKSIALLIPWELELSGYSDYLMPNTEFEDEVAVNGISWDDEGDLWNGLSLWRLVAIVDDDDPATLNHVLADIGYDVKVIAADGYNKTFSSADVAGSDDMIVANTLNGYPLPADKFPLRLVGPTLSGKQKVSQIVQIELLNLPALMESFNIEKMTVDYSRQDDRDAIFMNATFTLPDGATFDPDVDDVNINIDAFAIDIPAGSFKTLGWGIPKDFFEGMSKNIPHSSFYGWDRRAPIYFYKTSGGVTPGIFVLLNLKKGEINLVVNKANVDVINNYDGVSIILQIGYTVGIQTINMFIESLTYPATTPPWPK